jgi:phenylacetate-CoA ligase
MIPGGGRDSQQRLDMMRDAGATVLCCTPSYALRMAEIAREIGFDLRSIPLKATVHAGEPGASVPATKQRIQEAWAAKCFDHAGASEVGAHSFECLVQPGGTHLIESEYIAEVLNPLTGEAVSPGERGELVVTNLGRWGFPVIRYCTGDLVQVNLERCQCGRTSLRFEGGVLGRADDMVTVRGVNVFPGGVESIIRNFTEVDEFRITVNKVKQMDEMDIEVELSVGTDPELIHAIAIKLDSMLAFRPRVRQVAHNALPRFEMKAKRFHVKLDSDVSTAG